MGKYERMSSSAVRWSKATLLLVFDHRIGDLGVVEHVDEFRSRCVLVQRYRHPAQRLRGGDRPIQPRPIVADDREMHAATESLRGEAAGERAHFGGDLCPGPCLPDAEVLFAGRRTSAPFGRMLHQ